MYDYFKLTLQFQGIINYADLASNKKLLISHLSIAPQWHLFHFMNEIMYTTYVLRNKETSNLIILDM